MRPIKCGQRKPMVLNPKLQTGGGPVEAQKDGTRLVDSPLHVADACLRLEV